jgi:hypothetical protein
MVVGRDEPVAVVHVDLQPAAMELAPDREDAAGSGRDDDRARRHAEVGAVVTVVAEAAAAEVAHLGLADAPRPASACD